MVGYMCFPYFIIVLLMIPIWIITVSYDNYEHIQRVDWLSFTLHHNTWSHIALTIILIVLVLYTLYVEILIYKHYMYPYMI